MASYKRPIYSPLFYRLKEPRRFIQVLIGPRQSGKTTLVHQAIRNLNSPSHYGSADEPSFGDRIWIEQQWDLGRLNAKEAKSEREALLILDEIQKVPGWSTIVKRLWDEDTKNGTPLKVVVLGSAPLLIQQGLTESLAGRFELLHVTHWSFVEMRAAFGWNIDQFIYFGGYPGAADLIDDHLRWSRYIFDSLIETTLSRDILLMTRIDKPALLRRLFQLGSDYSGQIVSFQKMIGQLQDSGNTTTLAHYLELLSGAGMLRGLGKFSPNHIRQRASSPKLQILNTALKTAPSHHSFELAKKDRDYWGRLVETAVGAHLVNSSMGTKIGIYYWRERGKEVDFILHSGKKIVAIEVKSGRSKEVFPGMEAFSKRFKPTRKLLVGSQGIPLEVFLSKPAEHWVE